MSDACSAPRPRSGPNTAVVGWVTRGPGVPANLMASVRPITPLDLCLSNALAASRPRGKSNSERGRAFRERRKRYEDDLLESLSHLRKQVADLRHLYHIKGVDAVPRQGKLSQDAALRITRQYFAMFNQGLANSSQPVGYKRLLQAEHDRDMERQQIAFLNSVMDPDMRFGELSGLDMLVDQWRRYTTWHSMLRVEMQDIECSGSAEAPITNVHVRMSVRFSRSTVVHTFPHVAADEELVQRLVGKEVTYFGYTQLHFSEQGRVVAYDADVGFVDALVQAGISLDDIARLMQQALIKDQCVIGDVTGSKEAPSHRDQPAEIMHQEPEPARGGYDLSVGDCVQPTEIEELSTPEDRAEDRSCLRTEHDEQSYHSRSAERLDLNFILSA